ncbi:MAG TPA: hypothetical protein VGK88_04590 [bacterium]
MFAYTARHGNRIWRFATAILAGLAVLAALQMPVRAQSSASVISISVPVAQVLDGATVSAVPAGTLVSGQLTVKSNVPWMLVVNVDTGEPALVTWSPEALWQPLPAHGVVLQGPKGIHHLIYRLRAAPAAKLQTIVRFSLSPSP